MDKIIFFYYILMCKTFELSLEFPLVTDQMYFCHLSVRKVKPYVNNNI